ncbi:hypothetical protein SAMN04488128_102813 [Chitinophaga eiseniae]|uniref:AsmA-like C-terminal region n=1 Tax=Chitinophaga eiseniae TaxID=634771 RepID=A0A1T4R3C6_9BACT|nr:hypothetical protein [Chitinophaga eiseniae]SKA10562.1 hypothetical protein SAMN04488128_102813 [Chitinophaga eiseniae]
MEHRKRKLPRIIRIILTVLCILLVLVLGTAWYINQHWTNLLRKELSGYVMDLSDSLYVVQFKDLHLNVLSGSLTVEKATMTLDSAVYRQMLAARRAPENTYLISVEKLQLKYFKPWRYFIKKELNAGALIVTGPSIVMDQNSTVRDTTQPRTAYENISSKMKSIFIGRFQLDNTNFKYVFTRKDSSRVIHQFRNLQVGVNDFLIDSVALKDPTRYLYARNYEIGMRDYMNRTRDSLYWMYVRGIRYDAAERTLNIGQFEIKPRYGKAEFQQRTGGVQQDRYELQFNDIQVRELDPRMLLQEQQVWARRVNISNGRLHIYRDRTLPMPPGDKLGQFPNQVLQKVNLPLKIDTLTGNNVELQYTELSPVSRQTGQVSFGHVHGRLTNITNIDSMVARNNHCVADFDAIFLQSGKLRAHFDFILNSPTGRFAVSGQLKNMNGKDLNSVTRPLGMVEIRSCNIRDLNFNIRGDERKAAGSVTLLYDNLKIAILKQDKEHKNYSRKGLMSFVANVMVIKDSNPLPGEKVRVSNPTHARDIQKSFFNLVWKTLFAGVKETAGAGKL